MHLKHWTPNHIKHQQHEYVTKSYWSWNLPKRFVSNQEKNIWGLREYWQTNVRALAAVRRVQAELLLIFGRKALSSNYKKKQPWLWQN